MQNKDATFRKNAAIIIGGLSACPTLLFGLLLPCFFVLVPIIALMVYGIVLASFQLCAKA